MRMVVMVLYIDNCFSLVHAGSSVESLFLRSFWMIQNALHSFVPFHITQWAPIAACSIQGRPYKYDRVVPLPKLYLRCRPRDIVGRGVPLSARSGLPNNRNSMAVATCRKIGLLKEADVDLSLYSTSRIARLVTGLVWNITDIIHVYKWSRSVASTVTRFLGTQLSHSNFHSLDPRITICPTKASFCWIMPVRW